MRPERDYFPHLVVAHQSSALVVAQAPNCLPIRHLRQKMIIPSTDLQGEYSLEFFVADFYCRRSIYHLPNVQSSNYFVEPKNRYATVQSINASQPFALNGRSRIALSAANIPGFGVRIKPEPRLTRIYDQ